MDNIENNAVNAMKQLQKELEGKTEEAGLDSEEKVNAFVKEIRAECTEGGLK